MYLRALCARARYEKFFELDQILGHKSIPSATKSRTLASVQNKMQKSNKAFVFAVCFLHKG